MKNIIRLFSLAVALVAFTGCMNTKEWKQDPNGSIHFKEKSINHPGTWGYPPLAPSPVTVINQPQAAVPVPQSAVMGNAPAVVMANPGPTTYWQQSAGQVGGVSYVVSRPQVQQVQYVEPYPYVQSVVYSEPTYYGGGYQACYPVVTTPRPAPPYDPYGCFRNSGGGYYGGGGRGRVVAGVSFQVGGRSNNRYR